MKPNKFDEKQLKHLRNGGYEDSSVYIVLLDMCLDVGVEEVYMMLHNVASDMRKKGELEDISKKFKGFKWNKYKKQNKYERA